MMAWRMRLARAMTLLGALMVLCLPAHAQRSGTITGAVTNGTAGGPSIGPGLTVTLYVVGGEVQLVPLATVTAAEGRFSFEALDTDPALEYWPEVSYRGVTYGIGQGLAFQEGVTELQASLVVYEATEEDDSLRVESVHLVAESFDQVLRVSEVLVLANTSDRTLIGQVRDEAGEQAATVFIPLPANAVGLALPEGEPAGRFAEVDGGLWDTQPVRPGAAASVIRFSYHLMVEGAPVPLERRFPFPVSSLTILAVQPGLAVRGDQLTAGETVTFQDTEYQAYAAGSLGANVPLSLELVPGGTSDTPSMPVAAGTPARPAGVGQQGVLRWLGLSLVVIAAAGAVVYPFLARARTRA